MKGSTVFIVSVFLLLAFYGATQSSPDADPAHWPSFRGAHALGISERGDTPVTWSVEGGGNIRWKSAIPGLAHSSPIIWGDRVFVTSAVSIEDEPELKVGLYGSIDPVVNDLAHAWRVYCLDKASGAVVWEQTAHTGIPKVKRHPKSTHANSTPATNGEYVVAFFASEGLYCYDFDGELVWSKDLGVLDSGYFKSPKAQWGFASSPIIYQDRVLVQCDVQQGSFLAAFDIKTGGQVWRTPREEVPTWGTPTIYHDGGRARIAVNGFKHIGGYDFETGASVWRMAGGGDIPVPTPVIAGGLIFITNAHGKLSPIYAIRTSATGNISLAGESTSNEGVVWSIRRGGAYMQSPLVYRGYLYTCKNNGALSCFDAKTGALVYEGRLGGPGTSFSASPVASGGKLYFTSEQGMVFVLEAGREFNVLAENAMDEICMATPAIAGGTLYFRTRHHLVAVSGAK